MLGKKTLFYRSPSISREAAKKVRQGVMKMSRTILYRENPLVWNTYQCYLKKSASSLERDLRICDKMMFCHGAKIVRGAYMDKERALAAKKGVESPIWDSKQETDDNYDKVQYGTSRVSKTGEAVNQLFFNEKN